MSRAAQHGRSIIEMMVSIAIGLGIVVGVVAVFASASKVSRVAQQVGDVESISSALLTTIGPSIQMAGFGEIVSRSSTGPTTLFDGPAVMGCTNGVFRNAATGDFACAAASNGSDALVIRFQSDNVRAARQTANPIRDCLGFNASVQTIDAKSAIGAGVGRPIVTNAFRVNANNELVCFGSGANNGAGDEQALVGGVEEFKVYFGFDDVGYAQTRRTGYRFPSPSASSIHSADWINALAAANNDVSPWDSVVSVHVCVRVRTAEQSVGTQQTQTFSVCPRDEGEVDRPLPQGTASDGALRRTYLQTFTVQARATGNLLNGLVR